MGGPLPVPARITNGFLPGSEVRPGDGAKSQRWHTHQRRSRDSTARPRPHKTPVYPPAGQHAHAHALVLRPHPSCLCLRFGHGPELLASPCTALSAFSIAALHARAFNGTRGQHGKIWARKADGPCDENLAAR